MTLGRLQRWYLAQCDGEWEHSYGIAIDNLDNPGWSVRIDLVGTALRDRPFIDVEIDRSPDDWLNLRVTQLPGKPRVLQIFCGPLNLAEALDLFLAWAAQDAPSEQ